MNTIYVLQGFLKISWPDNLLTDQLWKYVVLNITNSSTVVKASIKECIDTQH